MPFTFRCRCVLDVEPFEEARGDLSTGGVFWGTTRAPHDKEVEVRLAIPGEREEIVARGEIIGARPAGLHVRFTALDTEDELRIARYIDEVGLGWD